MWSGHSPLSAWLCACAPCGHPVCSNTARSPLALYANRRWTLRPSCEKIHLPVLTTLMTYHIHKEATSEVQATHCRISFRSGSAAAYTRSGAGRGPYGRELRVRSRGPGPTGVPNVQRAHCQSCVLDGAWACSHARTSRNARCSNHADG
jgi:hypothetical protein